MTIATKGGGPGSSPAYFVASGTDTYTGSYGSYAAYVAGDTFDVLFTNGNTGASTMNINALGAKTIAKNGTTALDSGDIVAGTVRTIIYDGTRFQLQAIGTVNGTGVAGRLTSWSDTDTVTSTTVGSNLLITSGQLNAHFLREVMVDANYVFSAGKTEVATSAALTAPRTLTLPAANAFPAGTTICFVDEQQTITSTNTITITRAGADTVNGVTTYTIPLSGAVATFTTNGATAWYGGIVSISSQTNIISTVFMTGGNQTTTSNVAANVTDMVFLLAANSRYAIEGVLHLGCNNTGGVKICHTLPAGATSHMNVLGSTSVNTAFLWQPETGIGTLVGPYCSENNANRGVFYSGTTTTAGTAGNWQLQFASGTNTQTSTIYQEGTFLQFTKIV